MYLREDTNMNTFFICLYGFIFMAAIFYILFPIMEDSRGDCMSIFEKFIISLLCLTMSFGSSDPFAFSGGCIIFYSIYFTFLFKS